MARNQERDAADLFRLVAEQTTEHMVVILDPEGAIRAWNAGARALFGYEPDEVIGRNFALLFTPEEVEAGIPERELAIAHRYGRAADQRWHARKDDSLFYADGVTTAIRDDDALIGFSKIARDATVQKRAEDRLAELYDVMRISHSSLRLEELLSTLVDYFRSSMNCTSVAVLLLDSDEQTLRLTAARGLDRSDGASEVTVRVGEGFAGRVAEQREPLIVNEPDRVSFASPHLGEENLQSLLGVPLESGGRLVGVLEVGRAESHPFEQSDATLLQLAGTRIALGIENARLFEVEERARESASFLAQAGEVLFSSLDFEKTLQETAQMAVPRLADWCAVDVADEARELRRVAVTHVDPERAETVRRLELFGRRRGTRNAIDRVVQTGESALIPVVTEEMIRKSASTPEQVELALSLGLRSGMIVPLKVRERVFGAITFAWAESERRYGPEDLSTAEDLARRAAMAIENARLYHEARQATQAREAFMAMVSHELRTPMTSIVGWTQLLAASPPPDEATLRAGLQAIEQSAGVQERLIEDLLDVSRAISGKLRLEREDVELQTVIDEAVDSLRPTAESAGIRILARNARGLNPRVSADPERLKQVIWNLINNAIRFTPEGGLITVEMDVDDCAEIHVCDTGRGIAEDDLVHIFEPFRHGDGHSPRERGSLGLGLAIARGIVQAHGGAIRAESGGVGKGARFVVSIPLAEDS